MSSAELELAWSAGFFDGEGCSSHVLVAGKYRYVQLCVVQHDRRPLERFCAAVGEGNITEARVGERKQWRATGSGAHRAMGRLLPYLSEPKTDQWIRVSATCAPITGYRVHNAVTGGDISKPSDHTDVIC